MVLNARRIRVLSIGVVVISLTTFFLFYRHWVFADDCPPGASPATAANVPEMIAAGIPNARVGMCWNANDANTGQEAGDAKQWLQRHATRGSNISCLNAQFAERIKRLMEAVPGGPPTIVSAYRPPGAQNAIVASGRSQAGPCQSYHNYGMASDFDGASAQTLQWMRVNAPQFGLSPVKTLNPLTGCSRIPGSSFCDAGHIEMLEPLPPLNQCGQCASDRGDGTLPQPSGAPSAGISNTVRNVGSPTPAPAPASLQPQQLLPQSSAQSQPQICSPQFICSGNTVYYQASSCTKQVYQTCPNGCSGNFCASALSASTSTSTLSASPFLPSPVQPQTPVTPQTGTSTIDLLGGLANPQQTPVAIPTTLVVLNPDTQNGVVLQDALGNNPPLQNPASSMLTPPISQQTFTSGDMGNGGATPYPSPQVSALQATLASLKAIVLNILFYLKPFGGVPPAPIMAE